MKLRIEIETDHPEAEGLVHEATQELAQTLDHAGSFRSSLVLTISNDPRLPDAHTVWELEPQS